MGSSAMTVSVPTADEFAALERRVAALESAEPSPPTTGIEAKRAADLIELFGVNTFSSLDEHNVWGSWPADYRPEQVIGALNWMTADSGYALRLREYHYKGREATQRPWLQQIVAAIPGTKVAICPGANASTNDVPSMIALANDPSCGICWVEGLNEPNTDFGSGEVPVSQTKAIQDDVWAARASLPILGPSIVAGTPHPEGWITGYCGADLAAINAAMHFGNGHYYPPGCPDVPATGYSLAEYVGGLGLAYGHAIDLTEFHPTLYNSEGAKPDQPGWSGDRDAYYTLLSLFRCGKAATGLWWYALFDYGSTYVCGLFPTKAEDPRPAAAAIRSLCQLCADPGNVHSFTPGKLDVVVNGLPPNADWDLYQTSEGTFLLPLWRAAREPGGDRRTVSIELARPAAVSEWDVTSHSELQAPHPSNRLVSQLDASARLVVIRPL